MVRASKSAKTTLAVGQFEEWQNDSRALVDSATAARLRSDLATSAPDGVAPAQELLDSLGIVLWEALDIVFVVASVKAVLSLGFALFLRMPVRSEASSGDAVDTDGESKPKYQPVVRHAVLTPQFQAIIMAYRTDRRAWMETSAIACGLFESR